MQAETVALIVVKLAKAKEFLLMAQLALDGELFDAAVSNAATAAINAGDALCLLSVGQHFSGGQHERAVSELRQAGYRQESEQLSRILGVKTKAQYSGRRCTRQEADDAVKRAERLSESVTQKAEAAGVKS